jgi:hypothetical protein
MRVSTMLGTAGAMALMLAALWAWNNADALGRGAERPQVLAWAVRSAAIALTAGAQVMILTWLVGALYRRDLFGDVLRLSAALVCSIALVSAVALALAGR